MPQSLRRFFVADLEPSGDLRGVEEYTYGQLEQVPGAIELIAPLSAALWQSPEEFETPLRVDRPRLTLRWRRTAATAGVATVRSAGRLASLSLAASGLDADADRLTLEAYQLHLLHELRDTPHEPAFALMHLDQRPLLATIAFHSPPDPADQLLVALADRCFGAAFFRYLSLA